MKAKKKGQKEINYFFKTGVKLRPSSKLDDPADSSQVVLRAYVQSIGWRSPSRAGWQTSGRGGEWSY